MWSSGRRSDQRKFSVLGQRSKTPSKSTDDDASSRDLHRAWARVEIDHRSRKNALFDRRIDKPRERTSVVVAGKPTRSGRGAKRGGRQIRTEDVVSDRLHRAILRRRVRRDRYALEDDGDKDKDEDFSPSFVDTRTSSWSANDPRRAHVTRGRRIQEEEDRFARLAQRDNYTGRVEPDEEGGHFVERIEDDAFDSFRFGGKGEDGGDEVEENESEDSHFEEEEGGDGENRSRRSSRVKTKAEIYEEIIHKSKQYRALRAQDRESSFRLVDQLDHDLLTLLNSGDSVNSEPLLRIRSNAENSGWENNDELDDDDLVDSAEAPSRQEIQRKMLKDKEITRSLKKSARASVASKEIQEEDDEELDPFDAMAALLAKDLENERKARAADRIRSVEEIEAEEFARLQELERERRRRMHLHDDEEDVAFVDGGQIGEDEDGSTRKDLPTNPMQQIVSSRFVDSKSLDDDSSAKRCLFSGSILPGSRTRTRPLVGVSSGDGSMVYSDTALTPEGVDDDDNVPLSGKDTITSSSKASSTGSKSLFANSFVPTSLADRLASEDSIPFLVSVPDDFDRFRSLILSQPIIENKIIVLERMRLGAIPFVQPDKSKVFIERYADYLFQYFVEDVLEQPFNSILVDYLVAVFCSLIEFKRPSWISFSRSWLSSFRERLCSHPSGSEYSAPSVSDVVMFQFLGTIYPTSDFRHPILTSAVLLMCQCLVSYPILQTSNLSNAVYLCAVLVSYLTSGNPRFAPEVVMFLETVICTFLNFPIPDDERAPLLSIALQRILSSTPSLSSSSISSKGDATSVMMNIDPSHILSRMEMVFVCSQVLYVYCKALESVEFLPELARHATKALQESDVKELKTIGSELLSLKNSVLSRRRPLRWQARKAVALKMRNPRFVEKQLAVRDLDPDRDRARLHQVQRELRREKKAAMRDIRRESEIVMEEMERRRQEKDAVRERKYRKIMHDLEEQQHMGRELDRSREKRRRFSKQRK